MIFNIFGTLLSTSTMRSKRTRIQFLISFQYSVINVLYYNNSVIICVTVGITKMVVRYGFDIELEFVHKAWRHQEGVRDKQVIQHSSRLHNQTTPEQEHIAACCVCTFFYPNNDHQKCK